MQTFLSRAPSSSPTTSPLTLERPAQRRFPRAPLAFVLVASGLVSLGAVGLLSSLSGCSGGTSAMGSCRTVLNCKDDGAPICDAASLACRACQPGSDDTACRNRNPATPICGPAGRCVGCSGNSDCSDLRNPVCTASKACGPCQRSSDCLSGICSADGSCAPSSDVLYVNNKASCSASPRGSKDDPFCTIKEAVDAANAMSKSFISVEASGTPYPPLMVTAVASTNGLRIVGTSSGSGPSVVLHSATTEPALRIEATTATNLKLTVSGLDLDSASGNAVECLGNSTLGNASLTVESSRLHNSIEGLTASGCKITVDGARIYLNRRNGINLSNGSEYNIQNTMIWRNDVSGIALANSTGVLRFLTIYSNGTASGDRSPGIDCGAGNNPVEHSLVFSNISNLTPELINQQLVGCMTTNVLTNDSRNGTYRQMVPDFISASGSDPSRFDLRLKSDSSTNTDCCIDKVPTGNYINHDIDGNKRPLGTASDIGAHEAR